MAISETKRELSLTAIGMVAANHRKDAHGVEVLRQAFGEEPVRQHLLLLMLLDYATWGVEGACERHGHDPAEWLTERAMKVAAS